MEPLMPSEVARLVYGYLKNEKNEDTAECFLKSSPCLTECYQMFKSRRNFNIKVNGFNLHDIFDLFGTMCSMIEERISETCESKTLIEKLQYLLDLNHTLTKEDKSTETKLNMVDKCVGNRVHTKDQGTHISINIEANKSTCTSEKLLKVPLFPEIISNNVYKTEEVDSFNNETTLNDKRNLSTFSLSCPSSEIHLIDNNVRATFFKIEDKQSPIFQDNKQMCSTSEKKKDEPKINIESIPQFSPKYIHNLISVDQTKYQKVPEATSLDSMSGFSKEDRIKDVSIVIDTGELVDTFLNDQSLLKKIADTINTCFKTQKETYNILEGNLDPPTLEKALNSTQTDSQIKNILNEFLVFNFDNTEVGKTAYTNDNLGSIKSHLRNAKKKDDVPHKFKKNSFNNQKHIVYGNEECIQVDNNIVLIHEGNIKTTGFESYDLLSNQLVLLSTDSYNFDSTKIEPEEDYLSKANYVKTAPKITPMLKIHQVPEKHVFPKRRKHGIMSKFGKTNIISRQLPIQTPKSIIIEVPSQRSFETQEKINIENNDIIKLPEVSSKVNDVICYNTPDDRLQPSKHKQFHANINEQKNNQNQLIKSSSLKIVPKKTKQEKDPNFLKMFNNYNYSLTKKKLIKPTKYLKKQDLLDKTYTNNSNELNSPMKPIEPDNPNLVETPYKCDDAVVNVPKTPISKIKRQYDSIKSCTQEHYVNSLTETPSIKVFKKTSYLNKHPILQFPSTSGNLGSVDALIVLPEQDCIKTSKNTNCEIGLREFLSPSIQIKTTNNKLSTKTKIDKFECTPIKSKVKFLSKSKVKSALKRKSIEAKKKQLYESVKVELFGSEISSSSSSHELINTNEQIQTIIINKKPQDKEKISGFKHIPKRKTVNSMPVVNVTSIENQLLNELNIQPTKIPSIKPIIVQHEDSNDNTSEKIKKKNSKNIKKFMVHFDDPIEKIFSLSKSPSKSINKNTCKIPKKYTINDNFEQLIGLSRYLNKTSKTYDCRLKGKKVKTIEPEIKTTKTNNINSKIHNVDRSSKNISTSYSSNKKKSNDMNKQRIKLSESCVIDLNEVSYDIENNAVHNKHIVPLDSVQTKCLDDNIFNPNCITNKNKNSINNISCVTIRHDDKLDVQINNISDPIDNMEYLKKSKVYEVITEDGKHEMVYLHLSEKFIFLDILSELDSTQLSNPITSPLITVNKKLGDISEIESGELTNDEEILIPVTSTPTDGVKIKNDKNNRARRSPSIWEDSFHNYPIRHRDNRHRETNYLQNNIHRKYDKYRPKKIQHHNERLQFNNRNHFQRSNHQNVKREFWKDLVRGTDKFKHKDEKRCYHDYSKGKNLVEENPQRMSQSDVQKFRRSENIVNKALKRTINQEINNTVNTPAKVSKVEHQRLLTNVDVDDFLSVIHGKNKNL